MRPGWAPGPLIAAQITLEIVPDPDGEAGLPEPLASRLPFLDALVGEHVILVILVHQRSPRPVEVDGESECERFESDSVRCASIYQLESVDSLWIAVNRIVGERFEVRF